MKKCFALENQRVKQEKFAEINRYLYIYASSSTSSYFDSQLWTQTIKNRASLNDYTFCTFYGIPIFYIIQIVSQYINFEQ